MDMYLDDEIIEEEVVTKAELYGSRHARYVKRVNAENHLRKIEPYTMSVRVTRNGGIIRKGDTYSWLQEWKKMDRRISRHSGKTTCRNWQAQLLDESREYVPDEDLLWEEQQIALRNETGHWDFESQSFVWDMSHPANIWEEDDEEW